MRNNFITGYSFPSFLLPKNLVYVPALKIIIVSKYEPSSVLNMSDTSFNLHSNLMRLVLILSAFLLMEKLRHGATW